MTSVSRNPLNEFFLRNVEVKDRDSNNRIGERKGEIDFFSGGYEDYYNQAELSRRGNSFSVEFTINKVRDQSPDFTLVRKVVTSCLRELKLLVDTISSAPYDLLSIVTVRVNFEDWDQTKIGYCWRLRPEHVASHPELADIDAFIEITKEQRIAAASLILKLQEQFRRVFHGVGGLPAVIPTDSDILKIEFNSTNMQENNAHVGTIKCKCSSIPKTRETIAGFNATEEANEEAWLTSILEGRLATREPTEIDRRLAECFVGHYKGKLLDTETKARVITHYRYGRTRPEDGAEVAYYVDTRGTDAHNRLVFDHAYNSMMQLMWIASKCKRIFSGIHLNTNSVALPRLKDGFSYIEQMTDRLADTNVNELKIGCLIMPSDATALARALVDLHRKGRSLNIDFSTDPQSFATAVTALAQKGQKVNVDFNTESYSYELVADEIAKAARETSKPDAKLMAKAVEFYEKALKLADREGVERIEKAIAACGTTRKRKNISPPRTPEHLTTTAVASVARPLSPFGSFQPGQTSPQFVGRPARPLPAAPGGTAPRTPPAVVAAPAVPAARAQPAPAAPVVNESAGTTFGKEFVRQYQLGVSNPKASFTDYLSYYDAAEVLDSAAWDTKDVKLMKLAISLFEKADKIAKGESAKEKTKAGIKCANMQLKRIQAYKS